jgi:SagB-type dehydrogenase family enzyme
VAVHAAIRHRRSPHLVLFWRDGQLLIFNYATGDIAETTPDVSSLLDYCGTWRTPAAIAHYLGVGLSLGRTLIRRLTSRGLLQQSDRPVDPRDTTMAHFAEWNPAAGLFHTASRNVRFLSPRKAAAFTHLRARRRPVPSPVKRLRGAPVLPLPPPDYSGEFPDVLLRRRTWRRFGSGPVPLEDLATTLALSVGVQQWVPTSFGRVPLKTSPSGGARHPIEAYVCVRRVTGAEAGLYHYASGEHRLERIRRGDMTARLRQWMPHSGYFARAAFVVVLTAVLERQVWRYPYARAYRAALAEAGHVCQTFCLAATWRGLAPFCLMGLHDTLIEQDLGIDGVRETALYVAGAGPRPRGATWAPRARGTLTARRNTAVRPV